MMMMMNGSHAAPAPDGGQREQADANAEYSLPAYPVTHRAAHQEQCCEEEGIGFHDPLYLCHVGTQVFLQHRKGDRHGCAVNESKAGT